MICDSLAVRRRVRNATFGLRFLTFTGRLYPGPASWRVHTRHRIKGGSVRSRVMEKRPKGTEDFTADEFAVWQTWPLWKRYSFRWGRPIDWRTYWPSMLVTSAVAAAAIFAKQH